MKKLFIIFITTFMLAGCGKFYTCDIAGYIRDSRTSDGVNGALIRMYLSQPGSADSGGFIVETATMTSGGNGGYYSHKIIWQEMFGNFGDEGDSGTIWIGVTHNDYAPKIAKVSGILSDTLNVVPDIRIVRATFSSPQVNGRVVNANGEGVNGVRVILDIPTTTDDDQDYLANTTTINDVTGSFRFNNVTWHDVAPDSPSADTEDVDIYIDDPDYTSDKTQLTPLVVTLTSDQDVDVPSVITVTRNPRTEFQTNITGRCIYRYVPAGSSEEVERGISGVEVTLAYTDDSGPHSYLDVTDGSGRYNFLVQWTDNTPESGTGSVPAGEDTQDIGLSFSSSSQPGNIYSFSSINGKNIKSWIDPNNMPDSVDINPNG
ncbi:MAG: hypothetical protein JW969_02675 [Spirochaetales bacterium]|nr:hypothetical protein [Spirochaetales bacterium]